MHDVISVVVVDDHPFLRAQIVDVLGCAEGIRVVGECADGADVSSLAALLRPDIVLMDMQMPVMSGLVATRELMVAGSTSRVLMHTGSMNDHIVKESADAGALGFLLKNGDPSLLIDAVRTVAAGGSVWPGQYRGVAVVTPTV